jgi:hypothetical protein
MRRPGPLLAAILPFASVFALGCGGSASGAPDAAALDSDAQPSTGAPMGMDGANSDAGDVEARDAWSGASDASDASDDDGANDAGATPISWDGRAPLDQRASAAACPHGRDAGAGLPCPDSGTPLPGNPCAVDSDCTGGNDGVCLCAPDLVPPPSGSGPGTLYTETFCSYDQCFVDSDCGQRVPCDCRDPGIDGTPNVCLSASNCAVDSDCGPPGFCSPSAVLGQTPDVGFFCHTENDTCVDDSDCPVPGGPFVEACRFDTAGAIWHCFLVPTRP